MGDQVEDVDDLRVYRTAFRHAMTIFDLSTDWPKEEQLRAHGSDSSLLPRRLLQHGRGVEQATIRGACCQYAE